MGFQVEPEWLCKEHTYAESQKQGITCKRCKSRHEQFIGFTKRQAEADQADADRAVASALSAKITARLKAKE